MTCANITPAATISICSFVERYGLKLTVQEDGKGVWHASLGPTVQLYDYGTWASEPSWGDFTRSGSTADGAIKSVCETLSGSHIRLLTPRKRRFRFFGPAFDVVSINLTCTTVTPES